MVESNTIYKVLLLRSPSRSSMTHRTSVSRSSSSSVLDTLTQEEIYDDLIDNVEHKV